MAQIIHEGKWNITIENCPVCGSDEITAAGDPMLCKEQLYVHITCRKCGNEMAKWSNVLNLGESLDEIAGIWNGLNKRTGEPMNYDEAIAAFEVWSSATDSQFKKDLFNTAIKAMKKVKAFEQKQSEAGHGQSD